MKYYINASQYGGVVT